MTELPQLPPRGSPLRYGQWSPRRLSALGQRHTAPPQRQCARGQARAFVGGSVST